MDITILSSDNQHPVMEHLECWRDNQSRFHQVSNIHDKSELTNGDFLFLVSCSQFIPANMLMHYNHSLVLPAGDLPNARGWGPHIWKTTEGSEELTLTLLEANEPIDSGDIWLQCKISMPKYLIWDEINTLIFDAEINLMSQAVETVQNIIPIAQSTTNPPTYYRKRQPSDSRLNIDKSLREQFNLLRIYNTNRYPAFFYFRKQKICRFN